MAAPTQKGTQLVRRAAPTFDDYIVVADSWRERDMSEVDQTQNHDGEVINVAFADPGVDAIGDIVVKSGETPVIKGDLLVSTEATPRRFLVMDVETSQFGGKVLKQTVTLMFRVMLDSVLTT